MPKTLTQFGVEVRKKRVERQETLGDMAVALKVSPSFLSGIEVGRKRAPVDLVERIIEHLELDMIEAQRLRRVAEETGSEIRISLAGKGNDAREVAAMFARRFSEGDIDELKDALREIEQKRGRAGGTGL
jgi:predicted transcriptional regulator